MIRHVMDEHHIVSLEGIRVVSRDDTYSGGFVVSITYKGNHFSLKYPTRESRDAMFTRITDGLNSRGQRNANNGIS